MFEFKKVLIALRSIDLLEDINPDWKKILGSLLIKNEELDSEINRLDLMTYYSQFNVLERWISLISSDNSLVPEDFFWQEFHSRYICLETGHAVSHNYKGLISLREDIEKLKKGFIKGTMISIVASAPTVLNKYFTKNTDLEKFRVFNDFILNEKDSREN